MGLEESRILNPSQIELKRNNDNSESFSNWSDVIIKTLLRSIKRFLEFLIIDLQWTYPGKLKDLNLFTLLIEQIYSQEFLSTSKLGKEFAIGFILNLTKRRIRLQSQAKHKTRPIYLKFLNSVNKYSKMRLMKILSFELFR